MPQNKLHSLKNSRRESIASPAVWPSVASHLSAADVSRVRSRASPASSTAPLPDVYREAVPPTRFTRSSAERLDSAAVFGFPSSRAPDQSPAFQTFTFGHPSRVRACIPELFSGVCPNPMKSPNHALQRTAPRVTARAFCERSGIYILASVVRSAVGHAPRHAPPSLSLVR